MNERRKPLTHHGSTHKAHGELFRFVDSKVSDHTSCGIHWGEVAILSTKGVVGHEARLARGPLAPSPARCWAPGRVEVGTLGAIGCHCASETVMPLVFYHGPVLCRRDGRGYVMYNTCRSDTLGRHVVLRSTLLGLF